VSLDVTQVHWSIALLVSGTGLKQHFGFGQAKQLAMQSVIM
jgi:hypothetical protein